MFGSQILEVGIGLILVFLLVSLILTAVRETIESWQRTRARDLEHALAELLGDKTGTGLRKQLYEHPLVTSLFQGTPRPADFSNRSLFGTLFGTLFRSKRNLPSYIPRETFAIALTDLLDAGHGNEHTTEACKALLRDRGGDVARARQEIERWYDAAMDRAAGWYKRRTQKILFFLGVGVAVVFNINAIAVAQYLATNDAARTELVGIAKQLDLDRAQARREESAAADSEAAPENVSSSAQSSGDNATQASGEGATVPADRSNESAAASDGTSNATSGSADAVENGSGDASENRMGNGAAATGAAEPGSDEASRQAARRLNALVSAVGLPMGWDQVQIDRIRDSLNVDTWREWFAAWLLLVLGYLIVGFAATLGAPFWFDLLGKFMVVRSTVKPTEKSPDEASKDGGTGGAPRPTADSGPAAGDRPPPRGPGFTSPIPDRAMDAPDPVLFG